MKHVIRTQVGHPCEARSRALLSVGRVGGPGAGVARGMLGMLLAAWSLASAAELPPRVHLKGVPFTGVSIRDSFWAPRRETNRVASIPVNLENLEKAGNLENLRLAGRNARAGFQGPVFMDSDVYKALEAASYSLATDPDPALDRQLDEIIAILGVAQQTNGYLNSYFTVKDPDKRWTNLRDWHELYCAGHLFEAAVAHYQATGKINFLQIALRLADHIDSVFGPPPGKRMGYPGHPEIELALIKLWGVSQQPRYLDLARFFVVNRGRQFFADEHRTPKSEYDGAYWQDDVPITDHRNIKGHAVRACYLMSGATDVAAETNDEALLKMLNRVWRNTTERNMYLTGGIGPSAHNEGFTTDYDLPNLTAYQETCATIALAQWADRMALLYGDARYADVVERALYNGVLAGVSQDGTRFFYVNPLESRGNHHRSPWFGCACCPPNVARTLASLGGYVAATGDRSLWINLYIQGSIQTRVGDQPVKVDVTSDYPWDGVVTLKLEVAQPTSFGLRLRVPGWAQNATLQVNGRREREPVVERGYWVVDREWKRGDRVRIELPMPVERVVANPNVTADANQFAFQRGPLVYCVEECDMDASLANLYFPLDAGVKVEKARLDKLGTLTVLRSQAWTASDLDWRRRLYQPLPAPRPVGVTAIPYYAWDNRAPGAMRVWLPEVPRARRVGGLESQAEVRMSFASDNSQPQGICDGVEPSNSGEQPASLCHWWPHKGGEEWVEYRWPNPVTIQGTRVYWFDDTGRGECRIPAGWGLDYLAEDGWKPVAARGEFGTGKDRWYDLNFTPVTTMGLRLRVSQQPGWAAGVHEWKVIEAED